MSNVIATHCLKCNLSMTSIEFFPANLCFTCWEKSPANRIKTVSDMAQMWGES